MRWEEIAGQDRAVKALRSALSRDQVHHAYLLAGPAGVGKELLARTFAQAANCEAEDPAARPCGVCESCLGLLRGNFPDVIAVMPQAEMVARGLLTRADLEGVPSKEIRVDEVRALARRLSLKALRGRRKVAIVTPADAMNERAQNTLLKTLEEPPPATTFLLLSAHPDSLLPTIRSRCARVQLGPVPEEALVARLLREGVPEAEARERAARAQGSFSRALAEAGRMARAAPPGRGRARRRRRARSAGGGRGARRAGCGAGGGAGGAGLDARRAGGAGRRRAAAARAGGQGARGGGAGAALCAAPPGGRSARWRWRRWSRTATAGSSSSACSWARGSCAVTELVALMEQAAAGKAPPVTLIEGDEYLARHSARELADAIVPEKDRALNLVLLDASAGAREIAAHLMTVAMFAAPKAVVVEGADAFAEEVDAARELARARDSLAGQAPARRGAPPAQAGAACRVGSRRARLRDQGGRVGGEVAQGSGRGPRRWRTSRGSQELSAFALAQNLSAPPEDLETLLEALERGLPPRTHLILVAESLPPKHPLVRLAQEKGAQVKRRAERRGRTIDTLDISALVAEELGPLRKKLARDAELELKNRLGDDLRLIATELSKLALHAGEKTQITREDVEAIVAPVREEEFFALAEAVGEGDPGKALQLFADELRRKANASSVALPFLGGVASAVRKALADSARYTGSGPRELGYNEYQSKLFPQLEEELVAKKQKVPHPFAAWLGYKRARRRPRAFWRRALIRCAEADFELKNGADPRLCMERLLVEVCGG